MKVVILGNLLMFKLEEEINNFIELVKSENIIDIKYCEYNNHYTALIMYKEREGKDAKD